MASITTNHPQRDNDLRSSNFLEVDAHPTATFTSTAVKQTGTDEFSVTGDLTIKGVTKPVTLAAEFFGAGTNPMSKKLNVGFFATGQITRSEFGLGYGVPEVTPDLVDLRISAAFIGAE